MSRAHGAKAAKKRRLVSLYGVASVVEHTNNVLKEIACSSSKLSASYEESQRKKIKKADRKAALEEKRLQMKKYVSTLARSSVASTSDKKTVMEILRNSVLDEHRGFARQSEDRDLSRTLGLSDSPS
jgi:hypothetical protein